MNNQKTILDRSNQSLVVDLICYFSLNNKNYIFYDKNETVQDGLIKMYVASQTGDINGNITDEEWTALKKVMQDIITGNLNVDFLSYNDTLSFNDPKVIALNDTNLNKIRSEYKNVVSSDVKEPVLNKDILTQNFGDINQTESKPEEPVQISSIPNVDNNFNMESTPVNLEVNSPVVSEIPKVETSVSTAESSTLSDIPVVESASEVPSIEPIIPTVEEIDPSAAAVVEPVSEVPTIEPIIPTVEEIDPSAAAVVEPVSEVPTIEPIIPTVEEVAPSASTSVESVSEVPTIEPINNDAEDLSDSLNINSIKPIGVDSGFKVSNEPNIFDVPYVGEVNSVNESSSSVTVAKNDLAIDKRIELNERKIKLFEELANIFREENELLKQEDTNELEKTASNLFDNNGALDINEVLN